MKNLLLVVCFCIPCTALMAFELTITKPVSFTIEGESKMKDYQTQQDLLLKEIEEEVKSTSYMTGVFKLSPKVLKALKNVSRHLFVPYEEERYAYLNKALPIGEGQTISQPFIVAIMTELLDVGPADKVLEIGTGSGYQAAILSQLAASVYTIETFSSLSREAKKRFESLGYKNIYTFIGNGANGLEEFSPYHKIIVTAASEQIPPALTNQLSPEGVMVIPLGSERGEQFLTVVKKDSKGNLSQKPVLPVSFVPFIGSNKIPF